MYLDLLHGWPGRDSAGTASEMEHCNRIPAAVGRVRKKRQRSVSKTERKKKQRRSATGPEDGGEERYGLGMEWSSVPYLPMATDLTCTRWHDANLCRVSSHAPSQIPRFTDPAHPGQACRTTYLVQVFSTILVWRWVVLSPIRV